MRHVLFRYIKLIINPQWGLMYGQNSMLQDAIRPSIRGMH
jgi:hypothetical protein